MSDRATSQGTVLRPRLDWSPAAPTESIAEYALYVQSISEIGEQTLTGSRPAYYINISNVENELISF